MSKVALYIVLLQFYSFVFKTRSIYSAMTSNEAICKRISDLCKEQNITYYALASRAAIPKSTLMNILSGTNTTVATINKICSGLGITMYEFFQSEYFEDCEDD